MRDPRPGGYALARDLAAAGAPRVLTFGFNRWKQKPLHITCPGGIIELVREKGGTVRVTLRAEAGEVVHDINHPSVVRLTHEEEPQP